MDAPIDPMPDESFRERYGPILRLGLYALALFLFTHALFVWMPVDDAEAVFGEHQRIETSQVAVLGVCLLISIVLLTRHPAARPVSILATGFFLSLLVRELNTSLEEMDLWKFIVGAITLTAFGFAWRFRQALPGSLGLFMRSGLAWCAAGMLVHRFAAYLDERALWEPILGGDVPFLARRMGEESVELMGYVLILIGVIEWWVAHRIEAKRGA